MLVAQQISMRSAKEVAKSINLHTEYEEGVKYFIAQ